MNLEKQDLPATIQAFDLLDNKENFLAEQVVSNQMEIELFTARFAGKLIKISKIATTTASNNNGFNNSSTTPNKLVDNNSVQRKSTSSASIIMVLVVIIIAALVIYGFSTGWVQQKFNLKI